MNLITLNIWGGHVNQPLKNFVKDHSDIDIFCFQEMYHNAPHKISLEDRPVDLHIFSEIQNLLPNHAAYFKPVVENIYGLGIFIKKRFQVLEEGEIIIHHNPNYIGRGPTHSRNLQWLKYLDQGNPYLIMNVHGLWNGKGKSDCPERIEQSQRILDYMQHTHLPKILCGDFNLKPTTESLTLLEQGMTNLVKTHHVTSTRTRYYPKEEKFADYILISPDIKLNKFAVLPAEVSDHAPLFIEFS